MGQWPSPLLHGLAPTRHQSVLASLPRELQGGPRGHGWEPSAGSSLHLPPTPPRAHRDGCSALEMGLQAQLLLS